MSESKVQIVIRSTEDERESIKLMASKEMKAVQKIWKDKLNEEMYEEMMKKPKTALN